MYRLLLAERYIEFVDAPCLGTTVQERCIPTFFCAACMSYICLFMCYKRYVYFKLVYVTCTPGGDKCSHFMYQRLI